MSLYIYIYIYNMFVCVDVGVYVCMYVGGGELR